MSLERGRRTRAVRLEKIWNLPQIHSEKSLTPPELQKVPLPGRVCEEFQLKRTEVSRLWCRRTTEPTLRPLSSHVCELNSRRSVSAGPARPANRIL